jgi:hypothetical protein
MKRKLPTKKELSILKIKEDPLYPSAIIETLIANEIVELAKLIGIQSIELQSWVDLQSSAQNLPSPRYVLHLLRTAKQFQLDPLQNEILLTQYEKEWQVSIGVDGWIKLINRHPAFQGITFTESPETAEDLPVWMECTIYRSDRVIPICAREYLSEVKHDSDVWKKMPRRMLRHRSLQQCARLAFAINPPDNLAEKQKLETPIVNLSNSNQLDQNYSKTRAINTLGGVESLKMRLKDQAQTTASPPV